MRQHLTRIVTIILLVTFFVGIVESWGFRSDSKREAELAKDDLKQAAQDLKRGFYHGKEAVLNEGEELKDKLKEKGEELKENLQYGAGKVKENLKEKSAEVKENLQYGAERVKEKGSEVKENLQYGAERVKENLKEKGAEVKENLQYGAERVKDSLQNSGEKLADTLQNGGERVKDALKYGSEKLKDTLQNGGEKVKDAWDSAHPVKSIKNKLSALYDDFTDSEPFSFIRSPLSSWGLKESRDWWPLVDVTETDNSIIVDMELAGMKKDQVSVEVKGDYLIIRGEKLRESKSSDEKVLHQERSIGKFYRSFSLPEGVDASSVTATCRDGVLEVVILKHKNWLPREARVVEIQNW